MSRILIPRSAACSSKVVGAGDWEDYFGDVLSDHVICGFALSVGGGTRSIDVASGKARVLGLHLNNSTSCCDAVACLAVCDTHSIYIRVDRDCMCRPSGWTFTSNTTDVTPTDSFKIGTATTDCTGTTDVVTTCGTAKETGVAQGTTAPTDFTTCKLFWNTNAALQYNSGTEAVPIMQAVQVVDSGTAFPSGCCVGNLYRQFYNTCDRIWALLTSITPVIWSTNTGIAFFSEDFTTYADQCAIDTAWVTSDTCAFRGCTTCNELDFCVPTLTLPDNTAMSFDIGFELKAPWIIRSTLIIDTWTRGGNTNNVHFGYGITDQANCVSGDSGTHDALMINWRVDSTCVEDLIISDINSGVISNMPADSTFAHVPTAETLYIEFKRADATNYSVELFCCACYCMSIEKECGTTASTVTGLRFIRLNGWAQNSTADSVITGRVTKIEVKESTCW